MQDALWERGLTPSTEVQLVYSTAPAKWAIQESIWNLSIKLFYNDVQKLVILFVKEKRYVYKFENRYCLNFWDEAW